MHALSVLLTVGMIQIEGVIRRSKNNGYLRLNDAFVNVEKCSERPIETGALLECNKILFSNKSSLNRYGECPKHWRRVRKHLENHDGRQSLNRCVCVFSCGMRADDI